MGQACCSSKKKDGKKLEEENVFEPKRFNAELLFKKFLNNYISSFDIENDVMDEDYNFMKFGFFLEF